jgi:hypothetical protein
MIDVRLQNEDGDVEETFDDSEVLNVIIEGDTAHTKCLLFIDPYGDATFNRYQAEVLANELDAAAANLSAVDAERAQRLASFVRRAAAQVHTYVKFVGD